MVTGMMLQGYGLMQNDLWLPNSWRAWNTLRIKLSYKT